MKDKDVANINPIKHVEHRIMFNEIHPANECVFCGASTMTRSDHNDDCQWLSAYVKVNGHAVNLHGK